MKFRESVTIQMKGTKQYFPMVPFMMVQSGSNFWVYELIIICDQ